MLFLVQLLLFLLPLLFSCDVVVFVADVVAAADVVAYLCKLRNVT